MIEPIFADANFNRRIVAPCAAADPPPDRNGD